MTREPADLRTSPLGEAPEQHPGEGTTPGSRPAHRARLPWQLARRRRLTGPTISPDRLEQIRDRLLSGYYDTPEVRSRVAERVRRVLIGQP
ncbi:MAG TPA: hypothetical protein VNJ71_14150 [Gemmatimonadales bacterium]|jgi:hypothetical protein|nr:hypothetical protein [Gemmatimonadales bacterium]